MATLDDLLRARLDDVVGWQPTALRLAAVLCPVLRAGDGDRVLLVARPHGLTQHGGQLAFPGGMRDGEETPLETALRECREEIGVPAAAIAVLGGLPPRESSSGILVHCVVARVEPVPFAPDPREVDRVLTVPLAELHDESRWHQRLPPPGATGRQPRLSPHFAFGDELLWGLTARFVRDLLDRLRAPGGGARGN